MSVPAGDRTRLEHLARYVLRPPVATVRGPSSSSSRLQLACAATLAALAQTPVAEPDDALLEVSDAARRFHVSRSTIYEMLRKGSLQYVQKGGRGKLIPESEVRHSLNVERDEGHKRHSTRFVQT